MKTGAAIQPMSGLDLTSASPKHEGPFESAPLRLLTSVGATGAAMTAIVWWNATAVALPSLATEMRVGTVAALALAATHLLLFRHGRALPVDSGARVAGSAAAHARHAVRSHAVSIPARERQHRNHRAQPRLARRRVA
ncbi:MAG: hypothetical protein ACR2OO_16655 [Thermomicrobiales bacterium]